MKRAVELVAPARIDASGAETDEQLIALWLDGRARNTRTAYSADLAWWRRELGPVSLEHLRIVHVRAVLKQLEARAPATIARRMATLRSLLAFGTRVGYLQINIGAVLRPPKVRLNLAERILELDDVIRLVMAARSGRNADRDHLVLRVLYMSGARVSELVALDWRHVRPRDKGAALTLHGKGGKTRHVWVTPATAAELAAARAQLTGDLDGRPLFVSRTGRRLGVRAVQRIVERAARRAGLPATISPHWLRHAFATHAIERGAPVHVVSQDLGHASVAPTSRYMHARPTTGAAAWLPL